MEEPIVNRVNKLPVITLDLQDLYPKEKRIAFDVKDFLYKGIIVKEKELRATLKQHDWKPYQNAFVNIHCSSDAIVPQWTFMLVASYLNPICKKVIKGNPKDLENMIFQEVISYLDISKYKDKKVIIKGCGHLPIPDNAYIYIVNKLQPVVKSIMYGEACSAVPVYKRQRLK